MIRSGGWDHLRVSASALAIGAALVLAGCEVLVQFGADSSPGGDDSGDDDTSSDDDDDTSFGTLFAGSYAGGVFLDLDDIEGFDPSDGQLQTCDGSAQITVLDEGSLNGSGACDFFGPFGLQISFEGQVDEVGALSGTVSTSGAGPSEQYALTGQADGAGALVARWAGTMTVDINITSLDLGFTGQASTQRND